MRTFIMLFIITYLAIGSAISELVLDKVLTRMNHSTAIYIGIMLIWPLICVGYICWFVVFLIMLIVSVVLLFGSLIREVLLNE